MIAIVNESGDVEAGRLERVRRVLQEQVDRDFFPLWGWRAKLVVASRKPPRGAMQIWLKGKPDPDDEGAFGYHFIDGHPITYVFTRDEKDQRVDDYATTLSHEVLEMIADPGVNLYADGYYISKSKRHYRAWVPYEVCDPVEETLYEIRGVKVSDFVVPEWFEPEREPGSMDFSFRGAVTEPFELAPGGYMEAVLTNTVRTIWGEMANRRRRRHRCKARVKASRRA